MSKRRGDIWFVRSNGGQGSYPVTPEGWRIVWVFVAGIVASAIMGFVLAQAMPTLMWVGFKEIWEDTEANTRERVDEIGR